ncbi:MAG: FAD-dependent oxidoreductase [Opitutales bacterium]
MSINKFIQNILVIMLMGCVGLSSQAEVSPSRVIETDVLIYGATPSGVVAAMTVQQKGKTATIVEPGRWVGGILGAGLKPVQDMPNYAAVGGITRELMFSLGVRSDQANPPESEVRRLSREEMSPRELREDFLKLIEENEINLIYDHRINRVVKDGAALKEAVFDLAPFHEMGRPVAEVEKYENLRVKADIFIDASYDGDLMARSGVSYQVGRESTLDYDEVYAGVRPISSSEDLGSSSYELGNITPISPFVDADDPDSGLLPMVENDHGKDLGAGDHYTQAYNFRYYVTADPERKAPITKPEDYDALDFELVGRYVEFLKSEFPDEEELFERLSRIFPGWLNAGEYNYHRKSLITMAPLGISHLYANGDYATKAAIWKEYQDYLRGLHHFLSTDPRVPEKFREKTASLGFDKTHHPDTAGWPNQLYIRVSRRLVGEYTITEHDVFNRTQIEDPVGLAQYGVDTYPSRRIWLEEDGVYYVAIEGNMFVGGVKGPTNRPYPIPYRSLTPPKREASNLLVPVLFSATHVAYASARMEPTFMILGESAAVAAVQAIEDSVAVQDIDLSKFLGELEERGQRLDWEVSE